MKQVGIITYHHYYNYGTVLQAYALQKAVETISGKTCEIIDFRVSEEKRLSKSQLVALRFRRLFVYIKEFKRVWRLKHYGNVLTAKFPAFDKFFADDLIVGDKVYHKFVELKENPPMCEVYVTGSDQTFSPKIGLNPAMFLAFAPEGAKKVAYAPSVGVSTLTEDEKKTISNYLSSYSELSCREARGVELLKECAPDKDVQLVVDPTLLLDAADWNQIAEKPTIQGKYILCYFIGHRKYYRDYARKLSEQTGYPLYFIPVSWMDLEKQNNMLSTAGPKEFLGLVRDATIVLTDSFHGTIFSINYRKDFYSFLKIKGGSAALDNSRISGILERLGLKDRLLDENSKVNFSYVDYSFAEQRLTEERESSKAFLRNALQ